MSKWNGLERRTPLKRTPFVWKPKDKKEEKKEVVKIKKEPDLVKQLDDVFSLYVRLRDAMPGGRTVCISCGCQFPFYAMQAGHYFTRHHMATRWNELNVHSQCVECNTTKCGNLEWYAINLEMKIGAEEMEKLNVLHNTEKKWEDYEIKEMISYYRKEAKRLAKEKDINVNI